MGMRLFIRNIALIPVFILGFSFCGLSQNTDAQLAAYYFREGDFEKAAIYYERLYNASPSDDNYRYLLKSYLSLENFKEAEKLAERQSKNHPKNVDYSVDVAKVLKQSGETGKAEKTLDKLIKNTNTGNIGDVVNLGRALTDIDEKDRALQLYYAARKSVGDKYPFNFQIAPLLGDKGDVEGMITEYINVLDISEGYIQSVQNTLNRLIGFDEENKYSLILQNVLLEKVQKNPDREIYAEMLIWMYMQQNKYGAALIQAKAIDKRNREDGDRIMSLARTAMNNYKYQVAIDALEYVKEKGPRNHNYLEARQGLLSALQAQIVNTNYNETSINQLILEYKSALEDVGYNSGTWKVVSNYAHVKAFYESKFNPNAIASAIDILNKGLSIPGLDENAIANLKLELADIYVLTNRIWDASLLYGQVEKKFKYDEIGAEAKLKNAKVFYYAGDFGWAEAQLGVLKGSTSKLIANDALELSVFISENTGLDTTTTALQMFAHTELYAAQHKYDSALLVLDQIEEAFPGHELADNLYYQRAKIYQEQGNFDMALKNYLQVADVYSDDILADNALLEAGKIYELVLNQPTEAQNIYSRILNDYPSSLFTVEARKRFRKLRGDSIN